MPVPLYFDHHVPRALQKQLQRRGVDVLSTHDEKSGKLPDDELLDRATQLGRVVFTQDMRFWAMAGEWIRQGRPFAGLIFAHQRSSVGELLRDLELIAKATDPAEWMNRVEYIPYS
jgi:predicted nuclease of predicted toxin-antitoxin system